MALLVAAALIPLLQRPGRAAPLAALGVTACAVAAAAIGLRRPRFLALTAVVIAGEELVALGTGRGLDLAALPLAVVLFAGMELAYWAADAVDVTVEAGVRGPAVALSTVVGGLAALAVAIVATRPVSTGLGLVTLGLVAAVAVVAALSWAAAGASARR